MICRGCANFKYVMRNQHLEQKLKCIWELKWIFMQRGVRDVQSQGLRLVTPDCKICLKATLAFCKYFIELVPFVNMCFGTVWSHSVPLLCVLYLF